MLDLKRAYVDGKGDMDFILEMVPFTNTSEEPRLRSILQGMIDQGEVPEHKAFTHETPQKKERRKRKVTYLLSVCRNILMGYCIINIR